MKNMLKKSIGLVVIAMIMVNIVPANVWAEDVNNGVGENTQILENDLSTNMKESESIDDKMIETNTAVIPVYQTQIENIAWTQGWKSNGEISGTSGWGLRLEAIEIKLQNSGENLGVEYQTHIQNYGWEADTNRGWKKNGQMSGTSGEGLRLEGIEIKLTGSDADKYDIYYRVHAQNIGWMGWAKNGADAGTAGFGYRLEAIQIQMVEKNAAAPGSTERPFLEKMNVSIQRTYDRKYYDPSTNTELYESYYERPVFSGETSIPNYLNEIYDDLEEVWTTENEGEIASFINSWENNPTFRSIYLNEYRSLVKSSISYNNNNLVSITQEHFKFLGYMHGATVYKAHTFNTKTGSEYNLASLLCIDASQISAKLTPEFANLKNSNPRYKNVDLTRVRNSLSSNTKFYLTDQGVCVYFDPYEVADFVTGPVRVTIPYSRTDLLKPIQTMIP